MFEIVQTNRGSTCGNCRKTIPPKTIKLRFHKPLGVATVSKSLCLDCLKEMLENNGHAQKTANYTVTEKLIDYILSNHYDFEVEDGGGARGEHLMVTGMSLRDPEKFKEGLRKIIEQAIQAVGVNLVVKASKGVVVEGYAFKDVGDAEDKADDMRNSREFNENEDDVCLIYDVDIE